MPQIAVTISTPRDLPDLVRFFRAMAAAEAQDDPTAADRGEVHLRQSLESWDFLHSDTCPLLLARVDGEPAGNLLAVRIPKTDARVGFLFVDELYVLRAYRRLGVARALIAHVQALAGDWGLAGVRLLVRPDNEPARELYRQCGFREHQPVFCQWDVARDEEMPTPA